MQTLYDLEVSLGSQPWALLPGGLTQLRALAARGNLASPSRRASPRAPARTAIIRVVGPIEQRAGILEFFGIGTSCASIAGSLRSAIVDPEIDRIVLDIDSPGGSVFGLAELAAEIRSARAVKPVVGVANSMAASAAYWIGSACSELYCTPSGQVGSIGVIEAHEDVSAAMELAGVNVTVLSAGSFKAEASPFTPLGAAARAQMQREVEAYHDDFVRDVARGRNVSVDAVRRDMGQGRMMRGGAAQAAGMVDGVKTFEAVRRARPQAARIDSATLARMPHGLANAMRGHHRPGRAAAGGSQTDRTASVCLDGPRVASPSQSSRGPRSRMARCGHRDSCAPGDPARCLRRSRVAL